MEKRQNGGQSLSIAFNLNDTTLNGTIFTCRLVTSGREVFEETITLEVKGMNSCLSVYLCLVIISYNYVVSCHNISLIISALAVAV